MLLAARSLSVATSRCARACALLLTAPGARAMHAGRRAGRLAATAAAECEVGAQPQQQQAAGVHSSAPRPRALADIDRLQQEVESRIGIPRKIYAEAGSLRVRQHVNPLKKELQVPTEPPAWAEAYADPSRPLVLDVGCGYGRFLLALSTEAMPGHNMLGLEIRGPIIERANKWAASLGLDRAVLFLRGNATITLDHTLGSYPGRLELACVQFPDPHFKARHKKRHTVQKQMVEALSRLMQPGARVFLQSDVLHAAEHMRDTFEQHGSAWFAPCAEAHAGPTFQAASPPKPAAAAAGAAAAGAAEAAEQQPEQQQEQQDEAPQWQSQWAAQGWLSENPLGVPTEREVLTTGQGKPVYRVMLRRL